MNNSEPVGLTAAIGLVLSTGLTLACIYVPQLQQAQAAILGFGNALIWLGAALYARSHVTSLASPTLPEGTSVTVLTPEGEPNRTVTLG
jgi:hypothetical protein